MTKFEAMKQLPVERFADLFYEMAHNAKDSAMFKAMLMEDFPQEMISALQKCSTGEDLINASVFLEDSNNNHHKVSP